MASVGLGMQMVAGLVAAAAVWETSWALPVGTEVVVDWAAKVAGTCAALCRMASQFASMAVCTLVARQEDAASPWPIGSVRTWQPGRCREEGAHCDRQ